MENKSNGPDYRLMGEKIGQLVADKQAVYGDAFGRSGAIMRILYPGGVPVDKIDDMLAVVRIVDKLFRIANAPRAFDESPGFDIAGYGLLIAARHERQRLTDPRAPIKAHPPPPSDENGKSLFRSWLT